MFALDYFKLLLFFPLHLIFYLLLLTSTLSVAIFLTFPTVTLIMFYKNGVFPTGSTKTVGRSNVDKSII